MFSASNRTVDREGSFCCASRLSNVPSEVPNLDHFFLPGTLGIGSGWFRGRGPCANRTSGIDCVGPDSPSLAGAI